MDLGDKRYKLLPKKDHGRDLAMILGGVSYPGNPYDCAGTSEQRKKGPKTETAKREREEPQSTDATVESLSVLGKYEVLWKNSTEGRLAGGWKPLPSLQ